MSIQTDTLPKPGPAEGEAKFILLEISGMPFYFHHFHVG